MYKELKSYGMSFVEKVGSDLKSLRGLWCWVYLGLYPWLIAYCVTHFPGSVNTAITVSGGLVGTIFSGYVVSRSLEKNAAVKAAAVKEPKNESSNLP